MEYQFDNDSISSEVSEVSASESSTSGSSGIQENIDSKIKEIQLGLENCEYSHREKITGKDKKK